MDGEPKSRPPGSKSTTSFSRNTDLKRTNIYVTFTGILRRRIARRHDSASDQSWIKNITNRLNDARAPGLAEFAKSFRPYGRSELIPRFSVERQSVWMELVKRKADVSKPRRRTDEPEMTRTRSRRLGWQTTARATVPVPTRGTEPPAFKTMPRPRECEISAQNRAENNVQPGFKFAPHVLPRGRRNWISQRKVRVRGSYGL